MEVGEQYVDKHDNLIEIVSDDITPLKRQIHYAQIVEEGRKKVTKQMLQKDSTLLRYCFAIWDTDRENYVQVL